jgi:catechol 2,3-dioxygenase-like lactoylglutathione lyase family enzyme
VSGDAPIPPVSEQITFLMVADLERTDRFYSGLLGMPLVLDQGSCRIFAAGGTAYLGFCERPDQVSVEGVIVTLVSPDVDAWHDRLVAAGVPVEKAPTYYEEYLVYHAFYRDPDGYLVEIQEFRDPRWTGS